MIVNELEDTESRATIKEKFARRILSYVAKLPDGVWEYILYQLEVDPKGLFIKLYLLSVATGEPNTNLEDVMVVWKVTKTQFEEYSQELIQDGLLENGA